MRDATVPTAPAALASPDTLATQLRSRLSSFGQVAWTAETGSTNADLLARARGPAAGKPWLLGAHLQNTGRGRAGRAWQNRPGAALMFSCAFDTTVAAARLPALSPVAGLAACEALRQQAGPTAAASLRMKWPNDVQWNDAKLAGVLVETMRNPGEQESGAGPVVSHPIGYTVGRPVSHAVSHAVSHTVVIGMGLNLTDAGRLSRELDRSIADWAGVGAHAPLADVICAVALAWQHAVAQFEAQGFQAFIDRFDRVDALAGRAVQVLDRGSVLYSGIACGADGQGRLLLQTDSGRVPVSVGEISVRPA